MSASEVNHKSNNVPFSLKHPNIQFDDELTRTELILKVEAHTKLQVKGVSRTSTILTNTSIQSPQIVDPGSTHLSTLIVDECSSVESVISVTCKNYTIEKSIKESNDLVHEDTCIVAQNGKVTESLQRDSISTQPLKNLEEGERTKAGSRLNQLLAIFNWKSTKDQKPQSIPLIKIDPPEDDTGNTDTTAEEHNTSSTTNNKDNVTKPLRDGCDRDDTQSSSNDVLKANDTFDEIIKTLDSMTYNRGPRGTRDLNCSKTLCRTLQYTSEQKNSFFTLPSLSSSPDKTTDGKTGQSYHRPRLYSIIKHSSVCITSLFKDQKSSRIIEKEPFDGDLELITPENRSKYLEERGIEKKRKQSKYRKNKKTAQNFHKRQYKQTLSTLTDILQHQLLYFDSQQPGDFRAGSALGTLSLSITLTHLVRNEPTLSQSLREIITGDGRISDATHNQNRLNGRTGIILIHKYLNAYGVSSKFKPEQFQPVFLFPVINVTHKCENTETIISYFAPLLQIVPNDDWANFNDEIEVTYCSNPNTKVKDVFEWKPKNPTKRVGGRLTLLLNEYRARNKSTLQRVYHYETSFTRSLRRFLDIVKDAYISTFHHITNLQNIDKPHDTEVYCSFVNFFLNCPFIDLGHLFIKFLNLTPLDMEIKLKQAPLIIDHSSNSVLYAYKVLKTLKSKPRFKTDITTIPHLSFVMLICAVLQSRYTHGFILRSCLFTLDQRKVNEQNLWKQMAWCNTNSSKSEELTERLHSAIRSELLRKMSS